jgi:hypothetical protein
VRSACSRATNIVGTPQNTVTRCCSIASRTAPTSNRGTRTSVAPHRIAVFMTLENPKTWNSGSTAMLTSSAR